MVYAAGDEAMMDDVEGYPDAIALDDGWTLGLLVLDRGFTCSSNTRPWSGLVLPTIQPWLGRDRMSIQGHPCVEHRHATSIAGSIACGCSKDGVTAKKLAPSRCDTSQISVDLDARFIESAACGWHSSVRLCSRRPCLLLL
jgi:hypothetical protein